MFHENLWPLTLSSIEKKNQWYNETFSWITSHQIKVKWMESFRSLLLLIFSFVNWQFHCIIFKINETLILIHHSFLAGSFFTLEQTVDNLLIIRKQVIFTVISLQDATKMSSISLGLVTRPFRLVHFNMSCPKD